MTHYVPRQAADKGKAGQRYNGLPGALHSGRVKGKSAATTTFSDQTADSGTSSLWAMTAAPLGHSLPQKQASSPLVTDMPVSGSTHSRRGATMTSASNSCCSAPEQHARHHDSMQREQPAASSASQQSCSNSHAHGAQLANLQQQSITLGKHAHPGAAAAAARRSPAGGQLSRHDLSRAAAVITAALPAAKRRRLDTGGSSEEAGTAPELEGADIQAAAPDTCAAPQDPESSLSQQQQQQQQGAGKKPPRSAAAVHGNYHRYYGYRLGQAMQEDPRLKVHGSQPSGHVLGLMC